MDDYVTVEHNEVPLNIDSNESTADDTHTLNGGEHKDIDDEQKREPTKPANALQENIAKKGQNAYYYAHTRRFEPMYNFGGEPMKLRISGDEDELKLLSSRKQKTITKYSWADGKKMVQIYLEHPGIDLVPEENLKIEWESKSFKFTVVEQHADHSLHLLKLYDEIKEAKFKRKEGNKVVIQLYKASEHTWYQLQSK